MKRVPVICCLLISIQQGFCQKPDTFSVHFPFGKSGIEKKEGNYIDSLVVNHVLTDKQQLTVFGYTDYVGTDGFNDTLSMMRAGNVAERIINEGIPKENIKLCTGKG